MLLKKAIVATLLFSSATVLASQGEEIFKKCAICHGLNGDKKSLNVSELIAGWDADKIIKTLHGYKDGKIDRYGFGKMMRGQATKLNDKQMQIVAKFVEELKPKEVQKEMKDRHLGTEELKYNAFLKDYFKKNRNGTTKEAKLLWRKHLLEEGK
jgi:cytochrome c553